MYYGQIAATKANLRLPQVKRDEIKLPECYVDNLTVFAGPL